MDQTGKLPPIGVGDRGETITPAALRAMICDAEIVPVVLDSHSQPLDLGRRSRLATAAQRDALTIRDRGCTFPGFTAPPGWTRAHHITATVTDDGVHWYVHRTCGRWLPTHTTAA